VTLISSCDRTVPWASSYGSAKTYGVCARSYDGFVSWNKTDCMDASRRPNTASPVNWDTVRDR
jgi:hypothetical protein